MNKTYYRGDLYYADLNPVVGSEQGGFRPVVVIQNNIGNKYSPTVIVAPVTSKAGIKATQPTHHFIGKENGLPLPSIILLEQLRTIDKTRLQDYIGKLDENHIKGVNHALAISVGLIDPFPNKLILCLCPACASNFYGAGSHILRRVNTDNPYKDTCTYCNVRQGYDYEITNKLPVREGS